MVRSRETEGETVAQETNAEEAIAKENKKRLKEEKKKLKQEQKQQKKDAKARAKEIALEEAKYADESEGSPVSVAIVTIIILAVWIAILCLLIKLDVGGFGTNVMTPILKNIPVVNKILPDSQEDGDDGSYEGYTSLQEAVDQIKILQLQLEAANSESTNDSTTIQQLEAEITRLKTFEDNQLEFQKIKNEFYEEVVYAENGPGADEYIKYYESMDPSTAEALYKEVVKEQEETQEVKDYAAAYSAMKPKQAAAIFESMTDNLDLVARILGVMSSDDRGNILGAMDSDIAAKITKIMDPES
jgi:flagellar motility protein MotE (MotC chaperone)